MHVAIGGYISRRISIPFIGLWLTLAAATPSGAIPLPGDLDTTFDGDGKVTTVVQDHSMAFSTALQADGKIVVAGGWCNVAANGDVLGCGMALVRYNTDGSLDAGFDGDGRVTATVGTGILSGLDVAIQSDGKILVLELGGRVARYNGDGSLDATFAGDGTADTPLSGHGIAIQADGKILIAGGSGPDAALVRLNVDGSLDTSFDTDGSFTVNLGGDSIFLKVAVQGDGKIVVAGSVFSGADPGAPVLRYNPDGSSDLTFGSGGEAPRVPGWSAGGLIGIGGTGLALQTDGKIVIAGSTSNAGNGSSTVVRYDTDGSFDPGFGSNGVATTPFQTVFAYPEAVEIQADGKIVVAGPCYVGNDVDVAVLRYNTDGSQDTTFSGDGFVTTDFGTEYDAGFDAVIQDDGKIVVVGRARGVGTLTKVAVLRYSVTGCGDGILDMGEVDSDADGKEDPCDICAGDYNSDQLNSDCPDPAYFLDGCAAPTVALAGCCDGGDVCDACPAQPDNANCDPNGSVAATVDSSGGTVATPDGSVTVLVPAGALPDETSITITENGPATRFTLNSGDVFSVGARPENQRFDLPVTLTVRWDDRDSDARVDLGECVGGTEAGLSCDAESDCDSGDCSIISTLLESDLVLKRNSALFSKDGFGLAPFECDAHLSGGCTTATADCSDASGTGEATVANCCDKTTNEWTFQTCSFSEFSLGEPAGGMIPGNGSAASDCVAEWVVDNPLNTPASDKRGFPNTAHTCTDGDATCDFGGLVDGQCRFRVSACFNVDDSRLVDKKTLLPACTPESVATWEISKPRPDSTKPAEATNAVALRDSIGALGASSVSGDHQEVVQFAAPFGAASACTPFTEIVVPLKNGTSRAKAVIKVRTTTPSGLKDSDVLKLTCLPKP